MIAYEVLVDSIYQCASQPLRPVDKLHLSVDDILVACAGFEERTLASLSLTLLGKSAGYYLIAVEYLPLVLENHSERFYAQAERMDLKIKRVVYDRECPEGGGANVADALPVTVGYVYLDISGMSRLLIVQCIVELARRGLLNRTRVLYTEAASYSPSAPEVERMLKLAEGNLVELAMFVSVGVFGLTIVPELSSIAMAGCPMHVVIFPSWNPAQLAAVRAELQPTYYTILVPRSPDLESAWKYDAIQKVSEIESLRSAIRGVFPAPVLDFSGTLQLLVRIYTATSHREKIIIVPTGSKIQSVCVGLFRAMFSDIQIVYPTPRSFAKPPDYTRGIRQTYELSLSDFSGLVRPAELESGEHIICDLD